MKEKNRLDLERRIAQFTFLQIDASFGLFSLAILILESPAQFYIVFFAPPEIGGKEVFPLGDKVDLDGEEETGCTD